MSDYAGDIFSRIDLGFGTVDVPEFDFRQLVRQRALERETPLLPVLHSRLGRAAFPVHARDERRGRPRDARARRRPGDAQARGARARSSSSSSSRRRTSRTPPRPRTTGASPTPRTAAASSTTSPSASGATPPPTRATSSQVRALYDGAVTAIDDAAQTVLDALDERRHRQEDRSSSSPPTTARRSTTTATAQGHGDHLFGDEGTHVPLVVVDPRQARAATARPAIVRDVDLAPTLYALTGVAPPGDLDGQSLVPALGGRAARARASPTPRRGCGSPRTSPGSPASCASPTPASRG